MLEIAYKEYVQQSAQYRTLAEEELERTGNEDPRGFSERAAVDLLSSVYVITNLPPKPFSSASRGCWRITKSQLDLVQSP